MSFNRENIVWQSPNGLWNIGFYESYSVAPQDGEDWDEEWDVDYDYDKFSWASTGHRTAEAAERSWPGANPGGSAYLSDNPDPAVVARLDRMAAYYFNPALKVKDEADANKVKNKAHFEVLKSEFEKNHRFIGLDVAVTVVSNPETAHTVYGMTTTISGRFRQEGNWLGVKNMNGFTPVYDVATDTFANNIHKIRASRPTVWR